ncbi:MAG: hypothetical protein ACREPR_25835 [Brasilonema sp.]
MRRKPLILCALATVVGSEVATASVVLAQKPAYTTSSRIASSESTTKATVKTITQQIAELEVKRALLAGVLSPAAPQIQGIEGDLQILRKRLVQIQPDGNKAAVNIAVSQALKAKIAELEVKHALLAAALIPTAPTVQGIEGQVQNLRKRYVQIQPDGNKAAVNIAVSKAIKAKIAELEEKRSLLTTRLSPENPEIQSINSQLRSLEKRLIQLS